MSDPFAKTVTATVMGIELVLWNRESWERRDDPRDLWLPADTQWDGPNNAAPISEWPKIIKEWNVAKQVQAGFEVWDIHDDRPKYWHKRPAVFRSGRTKDHPQYYSNPTHVVHTRNGSSPDSLYRIERGNCAPDTPDMEAVKAEAMRLYDEAVEAGKRLKAYMRAVPRLSEEEWKKLPIKPGTE